MKFCSKEISLSPLTYLFSLSLIYLSIISHLSLCHYGLIDIFILWVRIPFFSYFIAQIVPHLAIGSPFKTSPVSFCCQRQCHSLSTSLFFGVWRVLLAYEGRWRRKWSFLHEPWERLRLRPAKIRKGHGKGLLLCIILRD